MNYFLEVIMFAYFVAAIANSSVKPTEGTQKPQCYVNNNFYVGPNCKKIEQQLAEIKEEIRALKRGNQTVKGL